MWSLSGEPARFHLGQRRRHESGATQGITATVCKNLECLLAQGRETGRRGAQTVGAKFLCERAAEGRTCHTGASEAFTRIGNSAIALSSQSKCQTFLNV